MDGEESGSTNESKIGGLNTYHTFSVDAPPFDPGQNASSCLQTRWQEPSTTTLSEQFTAMGTNASWPYPPQYLGMLPLTAGMRAMVEASVMMNSGMKRYSGTPIVRTSSPSKKNAAEGGKKEKGSLSIYAKPWSPVDTGLTQDEEDICIHLKKGWVKVPYRGEMVVAPIALTEIGSLFVHSLTLRPIEKPRIHLELYNYLCARCATHSFFGRLSCRDADVILKGIAGDIPPLRVAHLIEQVTETVVFALFTEGDYLNYEIWLETPDKANHVATTISNALWTCPMFHGYAVYAKSEEDKIFLHDYIASLKDEFPEETPYPMHCIEAIASTTAKEKEDKDMFAEVSNGTYGTKPQRDHSLGASYTPEEKTFHRLFPQIPLSEKLVESRQCSLLLKGKRFGRMGTLYASSLRLCFRSSFLKEPIILRWEDVILIDKGAGMFFEFILVKTKDEEEYIFSSFLSGGTGQTFKLLKTLWTVRARFAFSGIPPPPLLPPTATTAMQLPEHILDEPHPVEAPPSGSSVSPERPIPLNSETHDKAEDTNSSIPLGSSSRLMNSESSLYNSVLNLSTSDMEITGNAVMSHDPVKRSRSTSPQPQGSPSQQQGTASEKFKGIQRFPNIPSSELLIDSFQCSYVSGVHRLGKMNITTNYILFHSIMMSGPLQINFKDVKKIEKEQTMMILDGIAINVNSGKIYSFTSFLSRDAALNILTHFFNVTKMLTPQERTMSLSIQENDITNGFATKTSEPDISKFPTVESLNEFSKVSTDYGTALSDFSCFTQELIDPIVLPMGKTVLDVFKVCFDDDASVLEQYHKDRKDTNQKWGPWRPALSGSPAFSGQRVFTCTTIVKAAMTSKLCPFTEYQRYAFMNVRGREPTLVVQFSGQAEGVKYTDAFRAEVLLIFAQTDSGLAMRVFGYVQFLRSVIVKSLIRRTCLNSEMPKCYRKLGADLIQRLEKGGGISISKDVEEKMTSSNSFDEEIATSTSLKTVIFTRDVFMHWIDVAVRSFGLIICLLGLCSAFMMKFDSSIYLSMGGPKEYLSIAALVGTFFEFIRPTVVSALCVGVVVFYRFVADVFFF